MTSRLAIHLTIHLTVHLTIHLTIPLTIPLTIHLTMHLTVHLTIHLTVVPPATALSAFCPLPLLPILLFHRQSHLPRLRNPLSAQAVAAAAAAVTAVAMAEEAWRVRTPPLTLDFTNYSIYAPLNRSYCAALVPVSAVSWMICVVDEQG